MDYRRSHLVKMLHSRPHLMFRFIVAFQKIGHFLLELQADTSRLQFEHSFQGNGHIQNSVLCRVWPTSCKSFGKPTDDRRQSPVPLAPSVRKGFPCFVEGLWRQPWTLCEPAEAVCRAAPVEAGAPALPTQEPAGRPVNAFGKCRKRHHRCRVSHGKQIQKDSRLPEERPRVIRFYPPP